MACASNRSGGRASTLLTRLNPVNMFGPVTLLNPLDPLNLLNR